MCMAQGCYVVVSLLSNNVPWLLTLQSMMRRVLCLIQVHLSIVLCVCWCTRVSKNSSNGDLFCSPFSTAQLALPVVRCLKQLPLSSCAFNPLLWGNFLIVRRQKRDRNLPPLS